MSLFVFLFLSDTVVVAVDHHVDEVAEAHDDAIVRLELLLNAIEGEFIGHIVRQRTRWLKIAHKLKED